MLMPTKTLWTKQLEQEIISNIKLMQGTQILFYLKWERNFQCIILERIFLIYHTFGKRKSFIDFTLK
jgi:hypothetical protein